MRDRRLFVGVLVLAASVAASATAWASFPATDVFIPSTGRGAGLSESEWYTTLWVFNPACDTVPVTFTFLPRDQPNPASPYVYHDVLQDGETKTYPNAVKAMFGVEGFGAIRVVASRPLVVNSRIYSLPQGGLARDTVGQFFAAVPAAFAIGRDQHTHLLGAFDTSLEGDTEFRYNFGLVETTGASATVRIEVVDALGAEMAHADIALGPFEVRQYGLRTVFPTIATTNATLTVSVTGGSGRVIAFGSCLADRSNDPSTFEMAYRETLLAEASSVVHDASLTGDGTTSNPLGIADGGVGKTKLAATGGTAGQVLGTSGSGLVWQDAGGLTFPYAKAVSTGEADAFTIVNGSGHGAGVAGRGEFTGVRGTATVTTGTTLSAGVVGTILGDYGYGVRGEARSSEPFARGVYGEHASGHWGALGTRDYGAMGRYASGNFAGLGSSARAVFAYAATGIGVQAESEGNGLSAAAVLAKANGAGGIAVHASASSTDSSLVVTNQGTGDLLRAFAAAGELRFRVTNAGNVSADGTISPGGADFAELVPAGEAGLAPGEVLVVRAEGGFGRSTRPYQAGVAGVVSTRPGVEGDFWSDVAHEEKVSLAVVGIVPVKVCDEAGPVAPGDPLTTSSSAGVAMRAARYEPGTVVGTALAAHGAGTGTVPVLVRTR